MSNEVYANDMEVSCKGGSGKSICAFPDACFTPPLTPATPPGVPIPYPNTGMDSDGSEGSRTVQISGQEVMLKNKSFFGRSSGDEAGSAPKKGVMTSVNMGKVYFNAWSMDVKIESENVVRNLDLTTHNHSSFPGNSPTWPFLAKQTVTKAAGPCKTEIEEEAKACSDCEPHTPGGKDGCSKPKCEKARKCMLAAFNPGKTEFPNTYRCCDDTTGHHIIPLGEFTLPRSQSGGQRGVAPINKSVKGYEGDLAPTICVEGSDHEEKSGGQLKEHGLVGSEYIRARSRRGIKNNQQNVKYSDLRDSGVESVHKVFPHCSPGCVQSQLDNYHVKEAKIPPDKPVCRASQQSDYAPKPSKAKPA